MRIKAVIFDVSGVLAKRTLHPLIAELANEYKLDFFSLSEFYKPLFRKVDLGKMTERQLFEHIVKKFKIPISASVLEKRSMKIKPITGTWEHVKRLKNKYKLAILSNTGKKWSEVRKKLFHMPIWFDVMVWSWEVGFIKPDERIYRYACDKLEVLPSECVFVDDQLENVEGARKAGMKAIHFQSPEQLEKELTSLGVY
jgi:epoxide hydrolase-like predicted phosphatase